MRLSPLLPHPCLWATRGAKACSWNSQAKLAAAYSKPATRGRNSQYRRFYPARKGLSRLLASSSLSQETPWARGALSRALLGPDSVGPGGVAPRHRVHTVAGPLVASIW
jgi:hypothetical protein